MAGLPSRRTGRRAGSRPRAPAQAILHVGSGGGCTHHHLEGSPLLQPASRKRRGQARARCLGPTPDCVARASFASCGRAMPQSPHSKVLPCPACGLWHAAGPARRPPWERRHQVRARAASPPCSPLVAPCRPPTGHASCQLRPPRTPCSQAAPPPPPPLLRRRPLPPARRGGARRATRSSRGGLAAPRARGPPRQTPRPRGATRRCSRAAAPRSRCRRRRSRRRPSTWPTARPPTGGRA